MLSPADVPVVARDPQLVGLGLLLDRSALQDELRAILPGAGIVAATSTYLRYKPGTSCLAGYRLSTKFGPVHCSLKAVKESRFESFKERRTDGVESVLGPAVVLLPQHHAAVRLFPYDRTLRVLRKLASDPERVRLLRRMSGGTARFTHAAFEVQSYKPERRCVGRLVDQDLTRALLRIYDDKGFETALCGATFAARQGLGDLHGFDADRRIIVGGWIEGQPLDQALAKGAAPAPLLAKAGSALADLHRRRPEGLPVRGCRIEVRTLHRVARSVAEILPDEAGRLRRLTAALAKALRRAPAPLGPIHGDASADQMIVGHDGRGVLLIDWDRAGVGDPAADLGRFLACQDVAGMLGEIPAGSCKAQAFLAGYKERAGRLPTRVHLHHALALLQLLPDMFRTRRDDWPARMAQVLDRAEAVWATPACLAAA